MRALASKGRTIDPSLPSSRRAGPGPVGWSRVRRGRSSLAGTSTAATSDTGPASESRSESRHGPEGREHEVGHREDADVLDRALELSRDVPPEGVDEQREAGPHVSDNERLPQPDDVRAGDDHGAVDILLEGGTDVGIARVGEADDARASSLEGTTGGVGQPIASDEQNAP